MSEIFKEKRRCNRERIYGRLKMKSYIDKKLRRAIMRKLFLRFHFKLQLLRKFQTKNLINLTYVKTKEDVKRFFDNSSILEG